MQKSSEWAYAEEIPCNNILGIWTRGSFRKEKFDSFGRTKGKSRMNKKESYSSPGCLLTGLALFFLIMGVAEGMIGDGFELYWLNQRGIATVGVVVEWHTEERAFGKIAPYVTYRYNVGIGNSVQQVTQEELVSWEIYESLHQRATIPVVYLPDNPNIGTIRDVNHSLKVIVDWAVLTLGGLGLGVFFLLYYGLGQAVTGLGMTLIFTGVAGLIRSFFDSGAEVGPTRPVCILAAILGVAIMMMGVSLMAGNRQKEKPIAQLAKRQSNSRYATVPLHLKLSLKKLGTLLPELTGYHATLSKIARFWTGKHDMLAILEEHVHFGDSQPAVVISTAPPLVAAYTKDIDCVAILRFPEGFVSKYGLQVGSRLVTINTHIRSKEYQSDLFPGPSADGALTGFHPIIADFVSDDAEVIEARKTSIDSKLWDYVYNLGLEHIKVHPKMWRDGRPFFSRKACVG